MKTSWKYVTVRRKARGVQESTRRLEIKTESDPKSPVCQTRELGLYPEGSGAIEGF